MEKTQQVHALDLGEDVALMGVQLQPVTDDQGNLVVLLVGYGGHMSPIVGGFKPRPVVLAEIAKIPLTVARHVFKGGAPSVEVGPPVPPSPTVGPNAEVASSAYPKLILGGRR